MQLRRTVIDIAGDLLHTSGATNINIREFRFGRVVILAGVNTWTYGSLKLGVLLFWRE